MGRWAADPVWLRMAATVLVVVLAYGTVVHVVQLVAAGADVYPTAPTWLRLYFVSLLFLDPLAAVLLARRTSAGPTLAAAVLVTDAVANYVANYVLDDAAQITPGRLGQAAISALAVVAVVVAVRTRVPRRR